MSNIQKSWNQLISYISGFTTSHQQIKNFGVGFRFDLNKSITEDDNFVLMYMEPISHRHQNWTQVYRVRFYCLDLKQKDSSNEMDVVSDTLQILNDLIKYIKNNPYNEWNVLGEGFSLPITNYTVEFASGWFTDLDIEISINDSDCDIPLTTTTTTCGSFTTQYVEAQLIGGDKIRATLWSDSGYTISADAICNYEFYGSLVGSLGTTYSGQRTFPIGSHQLTWNFNSILLPGETIVSFTIDNVVINCPCVILIY